MHSMNGAFHILLARIDAVFRVTHPVVFPVRFSPAAGNVALTAALLGVAFLLQNGFEYIAAHIFGLAEFLVEASLAPGWKSLVGVQVFGLLLLVCGQFLRSLAMIHASTNFSHAVAYAKRDDHDLARHPSYAGFFYWAVGTQILLCNPLATVLFIMALSRFFSERIRNEERLLHRFFGQEYARYAARVPPGVPLVR
ncbi:protein-S-isoprenylcysteine O-methyltransferase [Malassezia japonica]|uniref:Protein-S-isoprenylcysteine O-methyltransferase n=1 Tax=Malassezia japonica TaxID=223818 RepID=A0AAF0F794_9BASI|nr:protein-S-isoprenylcysteine O-methyltransferase [Malassezia japonica]WFD39592.1 protein-S-isoprenylcysteine O-methyltransferase [Malassezia japonica]